MDSDRKTGKNGNAHVYLPVAEVQQTLYPNHINLPQLRAK